MKQVSDRIDLLLSFALIAETGSLTKAARTLGITQPTASRRLLELERLLGCKLASRTTASFSLTDEGRRLLLEARAIADGWAGLADRISGGRSLPDGTLRIIGPSGYGATFLTDTLVELRTAWPRLQVELTLTDRRVDLNATGADCWISIGQVTDPGLVRRPLGKMERILVASPAFLRSAGRISLETLSRLPCVGMVPSFSDAVRLIDRSGKSKVLEIQTPLRTDSLLSNYRAILDGAGVGSASVWMCSDDLENGRLCRVLPRWQLEPIHVELAFPPGLHRPARVGVFVDALSRKLTEMRGFHPSM